MTRLYAADIEVLYRDDDFLVLNKPPSIATTAPDQGPCLFALARDLDPSAPRLHPLSRLDTLVSGIVTFARTSRANHAALEARRAGRIHRRYLAFATQRPAEKAGEWHGSIAIDPKDPRHRIVVAPDAHASAVKAARTRFCVFAEAGPLCAFHLWPHTGRTHQLRVHAAHAGSALAGDVAYGGLKRLTLSNGRILTAARVMLHCAHVSMPHAARPSELLSIDLVPPEDMRALWRAAGGDEATLLQPPVNEAAES